MNDNHIKSNRRYSAGGAEVKVVVVLKPHAKTVKDCLHHAGRYVGGIMFTCCAERDAKSNQKTTTTTNCWNFITLEFLLRSLKKLE
jgi:predicted transcriptional regulator of viral defense system